jgi:mono/diheme cytochrome c family protein
LNNSQKPRSGDQLAIEGQGQKVRNGIILTALLAALMPAQSRAQGTQSKDAQDKQAVAESGKTLFGEYCASCHGQSGKGDGPVASVLKRTPADLTTLAARNNGKFPTLRVMQAIKAGPSIPAHGSPIMPVWGPIFLRGKNAGTEAQAPPQTPSGAIEANELPGAHGSTQAEVQLRIYNLTEYIKTLQSR